MKITQKLESQGESVNSFYLVRCTGEAHPDLELHMALAPCQFHFRKIARVCKVRKWQLD